MPTEGSVTRWIAELEFGHVDAAMERAQEELWQRYFKRLMGLASRKLAQTPRRTADEEDVAAAALNSFFTGMARGRFPRLHDRTELWPLLAKITSRKAVDQQRQILAEKRGGGRVRGDSAMGNADESTMLWPTSLVESEVNPEFLVEVSEECERLMALLEDEELRQIAQRRLEGFTNAEIAREIGVVERTIERRLRLIRSVWGEELGKTP
jgi:DNA-directed RNA polymerase specialized sigma24 family protein